MTNLLEAYLTVDQVAAILKKSRKTIYHYIARDGLPSHKIGKAHLIDRVELAQWIRTKRFRRQPPFRKKESRQTPPPPSRAGLRP